MESKIKMGKYLVTGGAGFIGVNLAHRLAQDGQSVVIADNLSRRGSETNLEWVQSQHPSIEFNLCDIRREDETHALLKTHRDVDVLIHLAGQVAVTTSVADPRTDFDINALGTFNLLEAVRMAELNPIFLFASTNKVYGGMEHIEIELNAGRYVYRDYPEGIDETCPLDFHSPYGCSKGAADQYVRDYHRIYGLRTVVFRQSAIYGPRQFGVEDQGWAAWFTIAALKGKNITIYGDGKQVRDLLWVDDLIDAYRLAADRIDSVQGEVFNIGGGVKNSISIWNEFEPLLSKALGKKIAAQWGDWRPGDQKVCIMNNARIKQRLGWSPNICVEEGIGKMAHWVKGNLDIL